MIAADTNLLVRHLTHDDPIQAAAVNRLLDQAERTQEPVFLSHLVVCEAVWALRMVYGFDKAKVLLALQFLLGDDRFVFQQRSVVEAALKQFQTGPAQFTDYMIGHVGKQEGAATTYTFDKAAAKSPNFTLLK